MRFLELLWSQLWVVGIAFLATFLLTLAGILVIQSSRQAPDHESRQAPSSLRPQGPPDASALPSVDLEQTFGPVRRRSTN